MNEWPHDRTSTNMASISILVEEIRVKRGDVLDLAWRGLKSLPDSIWQLSHLTSLYLTGNQLTVVPEAIRELSGLQHLDLSRNQLARLPLSFGQLAHLEKLDLSNNQLTELPESVGQLKRLKRLELSRNYLSRLPQSIGNLTQLLELSVSNNHLTELPESIGQLTQVKSLEAYYNLLMNLPKSFGQMARLEILYLLSNKLTNLPDAIGQLIRLKILDLSGNQLTELPRTIGQLAELRQFDLSQNQLKKLPHSAGNLTRLETLDLSSNHLSELPDSLRNLTELRELRLAGNQLLSLPVEILGSDVQSVAHVTFKPSEILDYYFRVRNDRRPLNEAKLILVGRGAVGKTSIVNRLVHDRFLLDQYKTDGIQITEWKLQLHGSENVRLNIWDFGGQEIMHATHQFFLTQRGLYLLVLNGREGGEDADAEYWLKLIESFGGESPIIIVLNKIQDHAFDVNRRALLQKYPAVKQFIKTDCRFSIGINELRRAIERETDQLEHLRDAFPASWLGIKDALAAMKINYLSFEAYRTFCERNGEKDEAAQDALASYLHNLGIVLNYKEDPRLRDTHVLNPHWVTKGIYRILNSEKLERQKGEIRLDDVSEILDTAEYPGSVCRFILDLMKKFDLCFSFPESEFHYLIPELLDKQEPVTTAEFKPEECLNFQYHYTVLPEGLLPRFIVRNHALSEGPTYKRWRTGVILEFEECQALVRADVQDKKVFISISGSHLNRRRLLAIIRMDFERIHRDIRHLQPQAMVPMAKYPEVIVPYDDLVLWEQNDREIYSVRASGKIVDINVQEMLNGVDLELRSGKLISDHDVRPLRLFYSYSHKDESLRKELETHLKLMQRQELIIAWHDRNIEAGDDWRRQIDSNLERADIILLLISPDFISSDYCYEKEMSRAMERHSKGEARVIPIIIRDISWSRAPFAALQALPKDGRAITLWENRDSAWRSVSEEIEKLVETYEASSVDHT